MNGVTLVQVGVNRLYPGQQVTTGPTFGPTFSNILTKISILRLILTKTWGEVLITKEEHESLKSEHVMGCSQTCCHMLSLAHSLALE